MLATMSCCLAVGGTVMESAYLGNCSAAVKCRKMGNMPVHRDEVLAILSQHFEETATGTR